MQYDSGWQAFMDRLAMQARDDERRRRAGTVGRVLWAVIIVALIAFSVGLVIRGIEANADLHRQEQKLTSSLHEISILLDDMDKKLDAADKQLDAAEELLQ